MNRVLFNPSIFRRQYDDSFQKIIRDFRNNSEQSTGYFPKTDVFQKDNSINFSVELPGVNKKDIKIILENGILSISGEKKNNFDENNTEKIYRNESEFGKFERKFRLQDDIDPDNVRAKFENGVLMVSAPLIVPEPPKEKVIDIN